MAHTHVRFYAGAALLLFGVVAFTGILPLSSVAGTTNQLCTLSVVQPCPQTNSQLETVMFGTYIASGGVTNVFSSTGTMTVTYLLGQGLTLKSYSLQYCTGNGCSPSTSIPLSSQGDNPQGFGVLSGQFPGSLTLNTPTYFVATITDSSGAVSSSNLVGIIYILTGYPATVNVVDAGTGSPISGAVVSITSAVNNQAVAQQTTGSSGSVTFKLAYGGYQGSAVANGYLSNSIPVFNAQDSPTMTVKLLATNPEERVTVTVENGASTAGQAVIPGAAVVIKDANGNQVGQSETTDANGQAVFTLAGANLGGDTYTAFASASGFDPNSQPFIVATVPVSVLVQLVQPVAGCTGNGQTCTTTSGGGTTTGGGSSSCTLNPSSNAGVNVFVIDSNGNPLSNAQVSGGGTSAVTDSTGHGILCNFPVPGGNLINSQASIQVTVSKEGFQANTQNVNVVEGQVSSATIELSGGFGFGGAGFVIGLVSLVGGVVLMVTDLPGRKR